MRYLLILYLFGIAVLSWGWRGGVGRSAIAMLAIILTLAFAAMTWVWATTRPVEKGRGQTPYKIPGVDELPVVGEAENRTDDVRASDDSRSVRAAGISSNHASEGRDDSGQPPSAITASASHLPVDRRDSGTVLLCRNCGQPRGAHAVSGRCIWTWTPVQYVAATAKERTEPDEHDPNGGER